MLGWTRPVLPLIAGLIAVANAATAVAGSPTPVFGAGSTWAQIALDQWRADIARQGFVITYVGTGSSAARELYTTSAVDFAASELPFQPDELAVLTAEHKTFQYVPIIAGGTAIMYNLHAPDGSRITSLKLNVDALAKIFTGGINSWRDPEILALNPGLQVREARMNPVVREDGSGTSALLSLYVADGAPAVWDPFAGAQGCPAPCSMWPFLSGFIRVNGSTGVANFIANDAIGSGSIGYVEAGYAFGRGFPVASLLNAIGNYTQPGSPNVSAALSAATLNPDGTANLTPVFRAVDPAAYPLSSYAYLITPTAAGFGFDAAKGFVLGTFINYAVCAGQRQAAPLGYAPLPWNLVADAFAAERRIPGSPAPPPLDYQHCPNPTLLITPASVVATVEQAFATGDISSRGIEQAALAKLQAADEARSTGDCTTADNVYDAFVNALEAQSGKMVTAAVAGILIDDLQFLIASCVPGP